MYTEVSLTACRLPDSLAKSIKSLPRFLKEFSKSAVLLAPSRSLSLLSTYQHKYTFTVISFLPSTCTVLANTCQHAANMPPVVMIDCNFDFSFACLPAIGTMERHVIV